MSEDNSNKPQNNKLNNNTNNNKQSNNNRNTNTNKPSHSESNNWSTQVVYSNSRDKNKQSANYNKSPRNQTPAEPQDIVKQEDVDIESDINDAARKGLTELDKAVNNMSKKMNSNEKLINRKINNVGGTDVKEKQLSYKEKIRQDNLKEINDKKLLVNKRSPSPNSNLTSNSTVNDKMTESPDRHCYNGIKNDKNRLNE